VNRDLPIVEPLQRALHLRSLDLFGDLGAHELALLASVMRERWLRRGDVLHPDGQWVEAAHVLVEGRVRLEETGQVRARIEAPAGVGLVELLAQAESPTRAVADTKVLALAIDGSAFFDMLEDHFAIFLQMRSALGRQLYALQQHRLDPTWQPPSVTRKGPPPSAALELVDQLIWLHRAPELRSFGVGVLASLIRDRGEARLAAGEVLWEEGAEAQFFVLVVDGIVRYGDQPTDGVGAGPGTLLGLEAAFAGTPHTDRAVAETPVMAIRVEVPRLLDVAEDHFHVAAAMLAHSARFLLHLQALQNHATSPHPPGESQQLAAAGSTGP